MKASTLTGLAVLLMAPLFLSACDTPPPGTARTTPPARTGWIDFALMPTPIQDNNSMVSNATRADLPY